jgi:hypothetical protein
MTEPMRWRMLGYLAALFIAGAVTGAAVMARMGAQQTLKVGRTEQIEAIIKQKLQPLELTADQQQKFDPLIKKASADLEASHLECLEKSSMVIDHLHAQIKLELTQDQQDKLAKMDEGRRVMMKEKYNYPLATSEAKH